jgi:cell division septation protein DedD
MAQTSPPSTPETPRRLTSRQRRIEEQRQRIDQVRREQQRKRLVWGAVILVALAVVAALAFLLIKPPPPAQGRQVAIEGNRQHYPQGSPIQYRNRPPSSGDHYDNTSGYGVFQRDIPAGNFVHTLEHGGIVVLYNCPQGCPDVVQQLQDVYNSAPSSQAFPGTKKMAVIPYTDMDPKIAVVAWGWEDDMDTVDKDRILSFYRAHVDRGPEQAP